MQSLEQIEEEKKQPLENLVYSKTKVYAWGCTNAGNPKIEYKKEKTNKWTYLPTVVPKMKDVKAVSCFS